MRHQRWMFTVGCTIVMTGCGRNADRKAVSSQSEIERGNYLVMIGGCHDCHTTKKVGAHGHEPDRTKLLAGHVVDDQVPLPPPPPGAPPWMVATTGSLTAWSGPWGISFAANLTPDKETGLGSWTEEQFKQTLKTGRHLGVPTNREILPPMPWFNYAGMTDEDFRAMFAYLRSIPSVRNVVPAPVLAAPRDAP